MTYHGDLVTLCPTLRTASPRFCLVVDVALMCSSPCLQTSCCGPNPCAGGRTPPYRTGIERVAWGRATSLQLRSQGWGGSRRISRPHESEELLASDRGQPRGQTALAPEQRDSGIALLRLAIAFRPQARGRPYDDHQYVSLNRITSADARWPRARKSSPGVPMGMLTAGTWERE